MNINDFERAARLTNTDPSTKTMAACRMVVERGVSPHHAARMAGVSHPGVYRKMVELQRALDMPVCDTCGQPKPEEG